MSHKPINFILALIVVCGLHFSCSKDELDTSDVINLYADRASYPQERELLRVRLAFAKTVAIAFGDKEFRQYFKDNFCQLKDNHYDELLYILHQNDVVNADGTTLAQLLRKSTDQEVRDIFGEHLLEKVLEIDPCVVIKMPDVFRNFDWNPECLIPVTLTSLTLIPIPPPYTGKEDLNLAYHFTSAHQGETFPLSLFHCYIKYSEDYLLLAPNTFENEKGIPFYQFIPQAQDCPNGMQQEVLAIAKPIPNNTKYVVVHKMDAFRLWQSTCGFKGPYYSNQSLPGCPPPACPQACIPLEDRVVVLDSFTINHEIELSLLTNSYLNETYTHSFIFFENQNPALVRKITVPSMPNEYFEARVPKIEVLEDDMFEWPCIIYSETATDTERWMPIGCVIKKAITGTENMLARGYIHLYADRKGVGYIYPPTGGNEILINASYEFFHEASPFETCFLPVQLGSVINYRISY